MPPTDDSRTPVLVGVGAVTQRVADPAHAREPVALMTAALERAAEDAGSRRLLERADRIYVPQGMWDYPDPGRLVAERAGASRARTVLAKIGILQTALFAEAARAIAAGEARIVLVTGGEAKYRALRAQILGCGAPLTPQPEGTRPDEILEPQADVLHPLEVERGLLMPVSQFAMIENALRHADGMSLARHRQAVAELWAGFSSVAPANPVAWDPEARTADEIATPSERNRMLAFPYARLHSAGWNVDQAAGLVFCSAATAREMGIPRERWIFPLAVVESNHMAPLCVRRFIDRSPGFACAGRRLVELAGVALDAVDHVELYSCFPAAVRLQLRALGLRSDRPLTVTGGMPFAGGPLNNFVLQALARMAEVLRATPGATGLVSAVSGIINKQGLSLWKSGAPARPFAYDDVAAAVAGQLQTVSVRADGEGPGTVASYTVLYEGGAPRTGVALVDFSGRERTIATTDDASIVAEMLETEFCGRTVRVASGGRLTA